MTRSQLVTVPQLLEAVRSGSNVVGLGSLAVTRSRESTYGDFSYTYFQSGLDVLTRRKDEETDLFLFFAPFSFFLWLSIIVTLYFSGHVIWFLERNYQPTEFPRTYWAGVNEGVWYCWGILTGTGTKDLIGFPSRMYSVGWSTLSVIMVAAYTANLATILTVRQLQTDISSFQELGGKTVGVVFGTTGEAFVQSALPNANARVFTSIEEAFTELDRGNLDAVIHDAPVLLYLKILLDTGDKLQLLGNQLSDEQYALLLPSGDEALRTEINSILLLLQENGFLDSLYRKWFNQVEKPDDAFISEHPQALSFLAISGMYITLACALVIAIITYCCLRARKWI
ncbi:uncharacterized protein AMSG_11651 [Thecamonas trahens ATCC 50062]|uniref:Solute-binding protein family 3/N-terminal domain-containing protein n=1 Tax=Thecamonas trahens ATCC 50062 TaxID=461836 RepID=A0A0L0DQQ1_THETB|nr:hypothetical protein AMSG_11651 [Thecamonas trahens ATCC 50062]KNC54607.1 hypothetical protein AMSG_11651 [Thecamonas trahens ATCC 50062]|eukprot:XP_013761761.1 hypothetical protein AMSG_11651 [Thecamonas trahens ATCC 50062]